MKKIILTVLLNFSLANYYFFEIYNKIPYFKYRSNNFDIGYKYGRDNKYRIKLTKYMSDLLLKYKRRKNIKKKVFEYAKHIDENLLNEMRGIAQGADLKFEDILQINCFLELSSLTVLGCYQVVIKDRDRIIHGRNLDWNNYFRIFNKLIEFYDVEEKGKNRVNLITFPGMIGAISGMNDKKISLAFNYRKSPANFGFPIFLLLRKALSEANSIDEVEKILRKHKTTLDFLVTVVDGNKKIAKVFEKKGKEIKSRNMVENILLCDNDYICFMDNRKQSNFAQHKEAKKSKIINKDTIKKVLKMDYELKPLNLYSYIYDLSNNDFYIANGTVPACEKNEYKQTKIFR